MGRACRSLLLYRRSLVPLLAIAGWTLSLVLLLVLLLALRTGDVLLPQVECFYDTYRSANVNHAQPPSPARESGDRDVTVSEARVRELLREAERIQSKRGLVLYTMLNDAYLEFALSWLCNTRWMPGVHDRVLLATTDLNTARLLHRYWPAVSTVAFNVSRHSGDQQYSRVGYVRMMVERTGLVLRLLESGVRLLLFEVDCVWLRDPLPFLLDRSKRGADIMATIVDNGEGLTAGGFLLLSPTDRTVTLWRELTSQMSHLLLMIQGKSTGTTIHHKLNDQEFLSNLIKNDFGGIRVDHLSVKYFPDGNWYDRSERERNFFPLPFIINNNFIRGNQEKKDRARKWGHWFLSPDWRERSRETICDDVLVKSVVKSL